MTSKMADFRLDGVEHRRFSIGWCRTSSIFDRMASNIVDFRLEYVEHRRFSIKWRRTSSIFDRMASNIVDFRSDGVEHRRFSIGWRQSCIFTQAAAWLNYFRTFRTSQTDAELNYFNRFRVSHLWLNNSLRKGILSLGVWGTMSYSHAKRKNSAYDPRGPVAITRPSAWANWITFRDIGLSESIPQIRLSESTF